MASGLLSETRKALAWFCFGCLFAATNFGGGGSATKNWNRFLYEESLDEEEGHDGGELGEESEEESEALITVTTVAATILVLIAFTILFEVTKEHIEEGATKDMKPLIQSLFGELTVLGFLSVLTFCVTKLGFFTALSVRIFGEHDEEGLLEIFESVHFCLFFVMIFFLVQVIVALNQALTHEKKWLQMDAMSQDIEYVTKLRAQNSSNMDHETRELLVFASLRDEFIKERSIEPPFSPSQGKDRIPDDFNFGRYLSICLCKTLAHSVHVNIITWVFYALLTVLLYAVWLLEGYNLVTLAWTWVGLCYVIIILADILNRYLVGVRNAFAVELPQLSSQNGANAENTSLLAEQGEGALPQWCKVDMDQYMSNRPWLNKALNQRKAPNRQDTLFLLEKKGPKYHLLIFQASLIFISIYSALLVLIFLPAMYSEGIEWFVSYIIIALIPIVIKEVRVRKTGRFAVMSQVACMGILRRPQVIASVLREDKIENIVRAFLVICQLNRAAEAGFPKRTHGRGSGREVPFSSVMMKDIEQTFAAFDHSGDGYIDTDELGSLMAKIGTPLPEEKLQGMMTALDENKDGKVCKDEFISWYADQVAGDDNLTLEEQVHIIFEMFDEDGTGEISIAEFHDTLDAFNVDFTIDEIGALVQELDEDDTGKIGLREFEELIEKHYPRELQALHNH
mmetsp:Transcript_51930/g.155858  ORF Transcript_51930/g.155858 Transcript_51930/m.155858 type:complete len:681 (-) Transcript_51930:308-2350(-)|eukprot:CAMPEP_0113563174 /NCGR_PEP_ID=MMETSP0015_2-20120614/20922_1 /TAXON_ID=2838 /ORGANISM="Odontella" /LENGTH=680 /DNA_ID=CAMNT_0000465125 /DNA_START=83 /DNA_END=2125 /DNA_ORIENTATION=- /assembly_acc=CAM_ASM_000160